MQARGASAQAQAQFCKHDMVQACAKGVRCKHQAPSSQAEKGEAQRFFAKKILNCEIQSDSGENTKYK
jgi:hypothetical protein